MQTKSFLTAVLLFSITSLFAQFEKGSKWIGGSFGFGVNSTAYESTQNSTSNNYSLNFNPSYSKFTSSNTFTTFSINYALSVSKNSDTGTYSQKNNMNTISLGYTRNNIHPLIGKIYAITSANISGGIGFSRATNSTIVSTYERKSNNYAVGINFGLGLIYQVNSRFLLTTSINNFLYSRASYQVNKSNSTGSFVTTDKQFSASIGTGLSGFNLGNLQFGLMYKLK